MGRTGHPGYCSQIGNLIVGEVNMGASAVAATRPSRTTQPRTKVFTDGVGGPLTGYLSSDLEV